MSEQTGRITQVTGRFVDVYFEGGELPEINTALKIPTRRLTRPNGIWWLRWQRTWTEHGADCLDGRNRWSGSWNAGTQHGQPDCDACWS